MNTISKENLKIANTKYKCTCNTTIKPFTLWLISDIFSLKSFHTDNFAQNGIPLVSSFKFWNSNFQINFTSYKMNDNYKNDYKNKHVSTFSYHFEISSITSWSISFFYI